VLNRSIEDALRAAVGAVVPDANVAAVQVRPCPDPKFGDYQSNAVMSLAKERKTNPRQLATEIVAKLDVSAWCEKVEIAGPGFLNFRLKPAAIEETLKDQQKSNHPFIQPSSRPRTVVIDFSSPNVAKPMHVGHIRSTILGDSLARTLRVLGHKVITDNHIGDWGTQFGMLLIGWKKHLNQAALDTDPIAEMERLYKLVNSDPSAIEAARQELVKLQGGDEENLAIWREMIRLSQSQFDTIYKRLGIRFDHTLGRKAKARR
jgi:arginyl-tRNA synthetase